MTSDPKLGSEDAPGGPDHSDNAHWVRMFAVWALLSIACDVVWLNLVGPHVPPGRMSSTADGAAFDFNVLVVISVPVMIAIWVYMVYAIITWRAAPGVPDPVGGERARGNRRIEASWISITTVIVLFLAGFGTYALIQPEGSGGGQGPVPIWTPSAHTVLQVQAIGQQWKWTYRYPSFGGFESNTLVIPDHTTVAIHVTSLDVVHSFWAYQIGVKADANPGQDNVAFTTPRQPGSFTVRCSELCGLWHGAMFNTGQVVSKGTFETWATTTMHQLAANTALLPAFAYSYIPDANGADGSYYPNTADPYSPVEQYGATTPAG